MSKLNSVKKVLLLIAFLIMPGYFIAQHCDSIAHHSAGWYYMNADGLIQLNDGSLLCRNFVYGLDENGQPFLDENHNFTNFMGYQFYWVSRDGLNVIDSLFVETDDQTAHLWARLHQDGNSAFRNVDACIVNAEDNSCNLKIAFFDDLMNYSDDLEVTVPLTDDEAVVAYRGSWLLDENNDIILQYSVPAKEETHFTRFGLNGTLKTEKIFHSPQMYCYNGSSHWNPQGLSQYSTSCYNYYGWGYVGSQIHVIAYELDQDFNITNTYDLTNGWSDDYYPNTGFNGGINSMVSLEDGGALIVRNTEWTNGIKSTGIVKYDQDGNMLNAVWFNQLDNGRRVMYCNDLKKDSQGNIYFTGYCSSILKDEKHVLFVKLDSDLNVIWEHSGMNVESRYQSVRATEILDNNSVAVLGEDGNGYDLVNGFFLMLISKEKGNAEVEENGFTIRPYLIYPNPVKNHLNVQYSPDVKPVKVEVLDLQGRLLSSQKSNLESIDMQNLPSGTYTINMTLDNGKTYSDKIVKQ